MTEALKPVVLIDTREQTPLAIEAYETRVVTLPVGDYGIDGFSDWNNPAFIVERKSLGDLIQSLTHDRERFEREILKLRQFGYAALLIECERGEVEFGQYRSSVKPEAVLQSLAAFDVRYGLHVHFCGSPSGATKTLCRLVRQFVRHIDNQHKLLRRSTVAAEAKDERVYAS